MKLKSLIISFSVACAVLLLVGGCGKEFLDTPVQNAISSDILASSQDGVEASLISTYKMLNGFTNTVGNTWGSAPSNYIFNSAADDVHKGSEPSDNPDGYYEVSIYQWSPGFLVFTHKFQAVYEGVRRANNTIQLANRFGENGGDAAEVARIIAEAKFLRTWYHFEAYKMWKNVPYYDETDVDFTKPNTEDIIPKLVADLEAAIAGLPDDRSQIGRVDKTVAQALLGKVKLYAGDLTGAKTAFDIVVDSDKYKLAECYNDNFTVATENNTETVFAFQASVNDGDGNGTNSNFLERLAAPHTGSHSSCCGFNNPTQDLANAYRVDAEGLPVADWNAVRVTVDDAITVDPRLDWTMGRTGVPYLDWGLHSDGWIRGAGWAGMYSPKKNMKLITDPEGPGWTTGQLHAKNVQLIRYADVLLMLAECEVEVEGGKFVVATEQVCPELVTAGMITDALFTDFDSDGKVDLVVVGEFMPATFFRNEGGSFVRLTDTGVEGNIGWWNSLVAGDFDHDGDIDYVAGNLGMNNPYHASHQYPLKVYAKDFDGNGSVDAILACYIRESLANPDERKLFPVHFWDELNSQSPRFRQQFSRYKHYAKATMDKLLSPADLDGALILEANYFESSYIENLGGGKFAMKSLPVLAQFAPVNGMVVDDVNGDGHPDVLVVGNDFGNEVFAGRLDALTGLILLGDGKGGFDALPSEETGFLVRGDAKALVRLFDSTGKEVFLATRNRDSLRVFEKVADGGGHVITPGPLDVRAWLEFANGTRTAVELPYGSGYLSQSSRKLRIPSDVIRVSVVRADGSTVVVHESGVGPLSGK